MQIINRSILYQNSPVRRPHSKLIFRVYPNHNPDIDAKYVIKSELQFASAVDFPRVNFQNKPMVYKDPYCMDSILYPYNYFEMICMELLSNPNMKIQNSRNEEISFKDFYTQYLIDTKNFNYGFIEYENRSSELLFLTNYKNGNVPKDLTTAEVPPRIININKRYGFDELINFSFNPGLVKSEVSQRPIRTLPIFYTNAEIGSPVMNKLIRDIIQGHTPKFISESNLRANRSDLSFKIPLQTFLFDFTQGIEKANITYLSEMDREVTKHYYQAWFTFPWLSKNLLLTHSNAFINKVKIALILELKKYKHAEFENIQIHNLVNNEIDVLNLNMTNVNDAIEINNTYSVVDIFDKYSIVYLLGLLFQCKDHPFLKLDLIINRMTDICIIDMTNEITIEKIQKLSSQLISDQPVDYDILHKHLLPTIIIGMIGTCLGINVDDIHTYEDLMLLQKQIPKLQKVSMLELYQNNAYYKDSDSFALAYYARSSLHATTITVNTKKYKECTFYKIVQ